ncbi:MAG: hypothetical protein N4A71_22955 [Carboxylicivirga sp.]|jgi:hypothetical protein|nr:hypothetical protein [Carboxylicivirga sp.]
MRKAIVYLGLCLILLAGGLGLNSLKAQEEVTDSLSIDDMPPVLYQEEEEEEEAKSSTGIYVAIGIAGAVVVVVGAKMLKKKK